LDMRMNLNSNLTAANVLATYRVEELQQVFSKYGEIRNSRKLATSIERERSTTRIETTSQLNRLLDGLKVGDRAKYFAQVYQALRIEVNQEMLALEEMLMACMKLLKVGCHLVGISYHSLEDRLVKRFLKSGSPDGVIPKDDYGRSLSPMKMKGKLILPSDEEQQINTRSRSAKMRVGVRI